MVAILIGGFFSFVSIEFAAVLGLLLNILLLVTIRIMINGERELRSSGGPPRADPVRTAIPPPPTPA
jgi:hypothetical protein